MTIWEAILIGLIQGLTEFLPVSSSGHILLCERILGIESELSFTLIMHISTLLAVMLVMRKDIWGLLKSPKKTVPLIVATLCSLAVVFAIHGLLDVALDGMLLTICFPITALMLLVSGFIRPRKTQINCLDAAVIGLVQGIAVLPGISRSGSTISTAVMLGNDKKEATTFSFLLSIPIIIGSALIDVLTEGLGSVTFLPLLFGFIAAFLSGIVALKLMIKLSASYDVFAVYLTVLTVFLLANDLWLHLF